LNASTTFSIAILTLSEPSPQKRTFVLSAAAGVAAGVAAALDAADSDGFVAAGSFAQPAASEIVIATSNIRLISLFFMNDPPLKFFSRFFWGDFQLKTSDGSGIYP
jgi:hypothetical protein